MVFLRKSALYTRRFLMERIFSFKRMIQQKRKFSPNYRVLTVHWSLPATFSFRRHLGFGAWSLVFFFLLLLVSCIPSQKAIPQDLQASCCQECLAATQRDPSGYDISIKPCVQYELSQKCQEYFAQENLLVKDCREE